MPDSGVLDRRSPVAAPATRDGRAPTAAAPLCAVVLVAWNNRDYLLPCLRSLFGSGMKSPLEVVIVDNGSTDGSQALVRQEFPDVRIVQNDRNVGLGKASNQGIAASSAPFVLLLNNDTIVNGPSLDRLIGFMQATPDAAGAGGTILNGDGTFQSGYNRFPTLLEEFLIASGIGRLLWPAYPGRKGASQPIAVDWITSACLLVRRRALDEVGLLDESYFIYGDEADMQYRLVKAGWKIYLIPSATTIHFGGRSLDRWRRRRMVYRGKLLFFRKNYGEGRTGALRALLAGLTAAKLIVWCAAWPLPRLKARAARELASNVDVLRLCWRPE
jgi:GT2 family glycosyltransferase